MCGVFGWFGQATIEPEDLVQRLQGLLRHRGPDDEGFEQGPGWGLGFRRLSILDLTELGHQPMQSPDGRYWIVFNGEVYNYLELRRDLLASGETFRSQSDTEVLLRLLARDGVEGLQQLNGMFAFALVDTHERTFLLARDRLGQKPLYYHARPGHLRFASELKALLAWPDAPRQVNPGAVAEYLALSYLSSDTCIFRDYCKLPPGHYVRGSLDKPEALAPICYWRPELNPEEDGAGFTGEQVDELTELLTDAVSIRLRSDVPLGVFLSGGIDSGLVAALAARSPGGNRPLALTVGFSEDDLDETALAGATAEWVGLEHWTITQRVGGLGDVDRLAWFYDEPFGDISALPTMTLCEVASRNAKVFLSGDGGDEAFGGYRRYVETQRYAWLERIPRPLRASMGGLAQLLPLHSRLRYRAIKSSLPDLGMAAVFDGLGLSEDPVLAAVLPADLKPALRTAADPVWRRWAQTRGQAVLTRQQALDYALYLPDDILVKVDRASMAHSIEVRSPFLDHRLVEWAARLPRNVLLNTREGKQPLRALGSTLLPAEVAAGSKQGFGMPVGRWFVEEEGERLVQERLLSHDSPAGDLWDRAGVHRLFTAHKQGRGRDFGDQLWRLLMLEAWGRHYLSGDGFLQGPPAGASASL